MIKVTEEQVPQHVQRTIKDVCADTTVRFVRFNDRLGVTTGSIRSDRQGIVLLGGGYLDANSLHSETNVEVLPVGFKVTLEQVEESF